jgi:hypothetical protein
VKTSASHGEGRVGLIPPIFGKGQLASGLCLVEVAGNLGASVCRV